MKYDETDIGWLMGWVVAGLIAAGTFIVLASASTTGRFDSGSVGDFLYNFQTLITGLLATSAALITVIYLRRHVAVQHLQARDTFQIGLKRSVALARNGLDAASDLEFWVSIFKGPQVAFSHPGAWRSFENYFREIEEAINGDVFLIVEREIAYPSGINSLFLRNYAKRIRRDYANSFELKKITDPATDRAIKTEWAVLLKHCERSSQEISKITSDFVSESENILRKYE